MIRGSIIRHIFRSFIAGFIYSICCILLLKEGIEPYYPILMIFPVIFCILSSFTISNLEFGILSNGSEIPITSKILWLIFSTISNMGGALLGSIIISSSITEISEQVIDKYSSIISYDNPLQLFMLAMISGFILFAIFEACVKTESLLLILIISGLGLTFFYITNLPMFLTIFSYSYIVGFDFSILSTVLVGNFLGSLFFGSLENIAINYYTEDEKQEMYEETEEDQKLYEEFIKFIEEKENKEDE